MGYLNNKKVVTRPNHVKDDTISVPPKSIQRYKSVTVCVDVMYVNKIAFFTSIAQDLKFGTGEMVVN